MKRVTIAIPNDLAEAVDRYVRAQKAHPTLTAAVQAGLRAYLAERGYWPAKRPFHVTPAPRGSGLRNVSVDHDRYLAIR